VPGVVIVNPHSGPDDTSPEEVGALFPGSVVEELDGEHVRRQFETAVAERSPSFLAVAGGDGTIRCAAGVVADTDVALVPVPAGTRNHFAKEVGIPTLEDAGAAASESGRVVLVDLGDVNGEPFVNNANIGAYPRIVREREVHEKRFTSKTLATLVASWAELRDLHKFSVVVDGADTYRAWMVFVGNGRYGTSLFDVGTRESLDEGLLDVRILRADGRLARLRVVARLLVGRVASSPMAEFDAVSSITLSVVGRSSVDVALDGELVRLSCPLEFRCRSKALRVLVPPPPAE
jgi:diacylglycerol kinase family enzyme